MRVWTPLQQDAAGLREGIASEARARRHTAWRGAPQRYVMLAVNALGGAATAELAGGEEETSGAPCQVGDAGGLVHSVHEGSGN